MTKGVRWALVTILLIMVFATFVIALIYGGFLSISAENSNAKIVASALVLVGGLFASIVTILGLFLKHSVDTRNSDLNEQAEKRLAQEAENTSNLKDQAEKRLQQEAAIQAVGLLSTSSGAEIPPTQKAAVLFTLVNLEQLSLALSLTGQLLEDDAIDATCARWVIDQGLRSENTELIEEAIAIFSVCAVKMMQPGKLAMPRFLTPWNNNIDVKNRIRLMKGVLSVVPSLARDKQPSGFLTWVVGFLWQVWQIDESILVKEAAGHCINMLTSIYPDKSEIIGGPKDLLIAEIRSELSKSLSDDVSASSKRAFPQIAGIEAWLEERTSSQENGN